MSVLEVSSNYKGNVSIMYDMPDEGGGGLEFVLNIYVDGSLIYTPYRNCVAVFEDYNSAVYFIDLVEEQFHYKAEQGLNHYIVPAVISERDNPYIFQ